MGITMPGLPSDPVLLVDRLVDAARMAKHELDIRVGSFHASDHYDLAAACLPWDLTVNSPRRARLAATVAASLDADPHEDDPLGSILRWKECSIAEAQDGRRLLAGGAGQVHVEVESQTPRVLFVSNPSGFSGAEESLCQMVLHLDRRRYSPVALISLEGYFARRLREAGVEVVVRGDSFGESTTDNVLYVASVVKKLQPAIVHSNSVNGIATSAAAALQRIPLVQHVRNGVIAPYSDSMKWAAAVVVISEFLRREILRFDLDPSQVHLIPDEVDLDYFRPGLFNKADVRREFGIPEEATVAVMIARLATNKRHDLILKAGPLIKGAIRSFHLLLKGELYGDSESYSSWHEQLRYSGLGQSVTWVPFVPDIRAVHTAADVLILCSDREGLGRCVVEAMAMELPVIVTNSGRAQEIVSGGYSGFVVESGNAEALAATVIEALGNPGLCRRYAGAARQYVERHLTAQAAASKMAEIYDRILSCQR